MAISANVIRKMTKDQWVDGKIVRGHAIEGKYIVAVYDAFAVKEQLKAAGAKWNPMYKAWMLECTTETLVDTMLDVEIVTRMAPREYNQMMRSEELPENFGQLTYTKDKLEKVFALLDEISGK